MTNPTTSKPVEDGVPEFLKRKPGEKPAPVAAKPDAPTAKPATLTSTPPVEGKPQGVERIKAAAEKVKAKKAASAQPKSPAKAKAKAKSAKPDGEKVQKPRSIVPLRFKERYAEHNDTCGSKLSLALKEATTTEDKDGRACLDVKALWAIAKANKVDVAKYVDLNNGQKRMNVYNRLIGRLNGGEDVHVGSATFKAEHHKPTTAKKPQPKAKPAAQQKKAA